MRHLWIGIVPLAGLLLVGCGGRDKPPAEKAADGGRPAGEPFKAIVAELKSLNEETQKAAGKAGTPEEHQKVADGLKKKYQGYAPRMLELARKYPQDRYAFDALMFVLAVSAEDAEIDSAVGLVLRDHQGDSRLFPACKGLGAQNPPAAEKLCRALEEKGKNKEVQGIGCLVLADIRKAQAEVPGLKLAEVRKLNQEAEELYTRFLDKYAGNNQQAVDAARNQRDEVRRLAVGKKAPEIEGEDADGKRFKLSDYKGKVVVLDFWARW